MQSKPQNYLEWPILYRIQEALLTPESEEVYCSSFGFIAKKSFSTFKKDSLSSANVICIAAIFSFFG